MHASQAMIVAVVAWFPLTLLLFRLVGARRAVWISVLGGYMFLPSQRMSVWGSPTEFQLAWKGITTGLALGVGVLAFDRQALRGLRFHWLDLAMALYVVHPLTGLAVGGPAASADVLEMLAQRAFGWLIPYVMGRLYFAGDEDVRLLAGGVVLATLAHAPVMLWECLMGPDWFAMTVVYRVPPSIEERLGSWTPQGFMMRRLELATWSSIAASLAIWLWIGRGWRPKWGPSWLPALALLIAALLTRSVFGYMTLAVGLAVVGLTLATRTRLFLALLAVTLPLYATLRMTDVLDYPTLVERTKEFLPERWTTVVSRLAAEQEKLELLSPVGMAFGRGHRVWSLRNVEPELRYPDGLWVQLLWEGGLIGLTLHCLAVHLIPAGCALSRPAGRPRRDQIGSPAWGLALFTLLEMTEGLHYSSPRYPMALIAGALVGQVLGRSRPWSVFETERPREESEARRRPVATSPHPPMPASVPTVAALACLLYVFAHGPVPGFDTAKLVGGLGAALLFSAAGSVAAWAAPRFSAARLAAYGLLFGALGISFNLALHPNTRPVASADLFQGLALAAVVVALGRKVLGSGIWADSALAVLPLLVHFGVGQSLPGFPGSQYLYGGNAESGAFFPLAPWLALAVLGARSSTESNGFNLGLAFAFGGAAAAFWVGPLGPEAPVKFPMSLSYAMLSCAAVALAFALARSLNHWEPARQAGRWLASRWLAFFYLHFAVAAGLAAGKVESAWAVWTAMTGLGLGATWAFTALSARFSWAFRKPWPWLIPASLIAAAAAWPSGTPLVVAACAGTAGLIFAAYWKELVRVVASAGQPGSVGAAEPRAEAPRSSDWKDEPEPIPVRDERPLAAVGRLALLLALLTAPEIVGGLESLQGGGPAGSQNSRSPLNEPNDEAIPAKRTEPSPRDAEGPAP